MVALMCRIFSISISRSLYLLILFSLTDMLLSVGITISIRRNVFLLLSLTSIFGLFLFIFLLVWIASKAGNCNWGRSEATTPRCMEGHFSFSWIAPLYRWYIPYNAEYQTRRYQVSFFKSLVWLDLRLNSDLPSHWLKKWYLMQLCFALSTIRWGSR